MAVVPVAAREAPATSSRQGRQTRRRRRSVRSRLTAYLFVLPMLLLVGVFLLYPAAKTIWLSFTNADGLHTPKWVGLRNYTSMFDDPFFATAIKNTLIWVVALIVVQVGLALALAVLIDRSWLAELYKRVLYIPATISGTAVGITWYYVFDPKIGVLNHVLGLLHLHSWERAWLTTSPDNTYAMIAASIWQGLGPTIVLFLVGLQNIPVEPVEAALVDGAGGLRMFFHITLPLLRPMMVVVIALSLINSFKIFDIIWVMTKGGPYRTSETLAVRMYRDTFITFDFGGGAAVAVLLTLIIFVVSMFYVRTMFRRLERS